MENIQQEIVPPHREMFFKLNKTKTVLSLFLTIITYTVFWKLYNDYCGYYGLMECPQGLYFTLGWFIYPLILIITKFFNVNNLDFVALASVFFVIQFFYGYILACIISFLLRPYVKALVAINWFLTVITVLVLFWLFKAYYIG
ncbi:MAG: hypothetical protein V1712_01270 [Patescibacteria group bacterium]